MKRLFGLPRKGLNRAGLFGRIALANLLALLPLAAFAVLQMMAVRDGLAMNREQAALGLTLQAARPITTKLIAASTLTTNVARLMPGLLQSPAACDEFFDALIQANPDYSTIGFEPMEGTAPCGTQEASNALERLQLSASPVTDEAELFLGVIERENTRSLVVGSSQPVRNRDGAMVGHVLVTIPQAGLGSAEAIRAGFRLSAQPLALVTFDEKGRVLTSSVSLDETGMRLPANHSLASLVRNEAHSFADDSLRGVPRVYAVAPIGQNLYLLGAWARDDDSLYLGEVASGYLLAGLMCVSGLVAALFAAERLVIQHIRKLSAAMTSFAQGNRRNTDPDLKSPPREIADLAEAYDNLTQTIFRDEADMVNYLHEKEKLLRELHHRTGNSMQLIASILRMHLREAPEPEVRTILENLHDRVMGLSTVHLGLYKISDYDVVEMHQLLAEVITKIDALRGAVAGRHRVKADLQPIQLAIVQAVPLALLVAEVVSAFLYGSSGTDEAGGTERERVGVALSGPTHQQLVTLTITGPVSARSRISGTGGGAPGAIAARLIRGFLRQIDGEMDMSERDGQLVMRIRFTARLNTTQPANAA